MKQTLAKWFPTILLCLLIGNIRAQMRQLSLEPDANNHLLKTSFYSEKEGYMAFSKNLAYTQDSGITYTKKFISISNVNFNGYPVNLTFGFTIKGVHAFNKDTLLAYGHYGLIPAILYSTDQANSFKLVFHSLLTPGQYNDGVLQMAFPTRNIGYAIDNDRVLKTTNGGLNWSSTKNSQGAGFSGLQFLDANTGWAMGSYSFQKTNNGGTAWQALTVPGGQLNSFYALTENKLWLNLYNDSYGQVHYSANGGSTWGFRNNSGFYSISGALVNFINDSTGYALGESFMLYKTTDSGRIWEPLQRINNYTYLGYTHNTFARASANQFWAGGGHGLLEISTNNGGATLPVAKFMADVSSLAINNTVKLKNYSKLGSSYRWLKNATQFSTTYDASYTSNRTTIDTIKLIVTKNGFSDTSLQIVDTRANTQPCNGGFTYVTDTAVARFTASYHTYGVKHYWYFGDGTMDSSTVNPMHVYTAVNYYDVKHKVKNTITGCEDSVTQNVQIVRLAKCSQGQLSYTALDTFFTNNITLKYTPDLTTDMGATNITTVWNFGDGKPNAGGTTVVHSFDSSKYYTVNATITNLWTSCVVTRPIVVFVDIPTACNANFRTTATAAQDLLFTGKPNAANGSKINKWILYGRDTITTGSTNSYSRRFYSEGNDGQTFNYIRGGAGAGAACNYPQTNQYNLDSLIVPVKHIMQDNSIGCTDTFTTTVRVPTQKQVYITAVPDPLFPFWVNFKAYSYNVYGVDSTPYPTIWREYTPDPYEGTGYGYMGSYQDPYYTGIKAMVSGFAQVAITSSNCGPGPSQGNRELYYKNFSFPVMTACDAYPPNFTYTNAVGQPNKITFSINYPVDYINSVNMNWSRKWYFGTGDSSTAAAPTYTFPTTGTFNVTLKYTNWAGCPVSVTKTVSTGALPVGLISFTAKKYAAQNLLQWVTATETNNAGFEVERSADGSSFYQIGFEPAQGNGNSHAAITYSYADKQPLGSSNYYRLKQVDKDGKYTYSNIAALGNNVESERLSIVEIYPNPASNYLTVRLLSPDNRKKKAIITSALGSVVKEQLLEVRKGSNELYLSLGSLLPATYFLTIVDAVTGQKVHTHFIKL